MSRSETKTMTRRRFLKLTGSSAVAGLLMTACKPPAPTAPPPSGVPGATAASATAIPQPTAVPASLPEAQLVYTYPGTVPADVDLVSDALSKVLKERINASIKLEPVDWEPYESRIRLAHSAGEVFDLEFTATWINNYAQNVANGNLVALDDLLTQYAPGLWASMPPTTWDAARIQGKIRGVLNQQIFVKDWGFRVRKDLAEKYQLDLDSIKKYEDLEPFLKELKQGDPQIIPTVYGPKGSVVWWAEYHGFDPIWEIYGNCTVAAVRYDDPDLKVVSVVDSPEFEASCRLARRWVEAGYIRSEMMGADELKSAYRAGQVAMENHMVTPDTMESLKNTYGFEWVGKGLSPWMLTTASSVATLNGINRTSRNAERTMMLLEMLNTDVEFYNLICNGIEGKHWVWVDKEKKVIGLPEGLTQETSPYFPSTDWMFGCQFNAYYRSEALADLQVYDATRKMNADAKPSEALGFSFVVDKVSTEVSQITNVVTETWFPLKNGLTDVDKELPRLKAALKDAGLERLLAEVQRQLDEWKASA